MTETVWGYYITAHYQDQLSVQYQEEKAERLAAAAAAARDLGGGSVPGQEVFQAAEAADAEL